MGLWTVSADGGSPELLIRNAGYGSYAPDGSVIAFHPVGSEVDVGWWRWRHMIVLADADGGHRRAVERGGGTLMAPIEYDHTYLVWSPDGTRVVCTCGPRGPEGPVGIWDVRSGHARFVAYGTSPTWLDDDTLIVGSFTAPRLSAVPAPSA
jgi:hypothetical protein